jgi:hypothetical protein
MGKTGIASMLSERDTVVAHHFCRHDDSDKRNPARAIRSIAYQLAEAFPDYRDKLLAADLTADKLREKNIKALFHTVLKEPLSTLSVPGARKIILIDALDECDENGRNDLLRCIRDHFIELPPWLALFLTTRPEVNILKPLAKFCPVALEADSDENMADVTCYIRDHLKGRLPEAMLDVGTAVLVEKSKGVFIYARYAVERLQPHVTVDELHEFPDGITDFYDEQFERLLRADDISSASAKWRIIEAVITACEPLHIDHLDALVGCTTIERKQAVAKLSLLFPIRGRRLHVFHKSVKDWLVDAQRKDEMCYVDVDKVHAAMGRKCQELWPTMEYGLKHAVTHLCAGGLTKQARDLMFVFDWLLARARLGPPHALVLDGNRVAREHQDRAFELLHSALRLMQSGLATNPLQMAGQLVGRLMGYGDAATKFHEAEIEALLTTARAWKGVDGRGWLCPLGQTYEPAGSPCRQTMVGHSDSVRSVSFSPDGKHVASGSSDNTVKVWSVESGECVFTGSQLDDSWRAVFKDSSMSEHFDDTHTIGLSGEGQNTNPSVYIRNTRAVIVDGAALHVLERRP